MRPVVAACAVVWIGAAAAAASSGSHLRLLIPTGLIEPDIPLQSSFTAAVVNLGRQLFFDKSLSKDGKTSCATCHDPQRAFADDRRLPIDAAGRVVRRNSQAIANAGFLPTLSWDGRHRSLEQQAIDAFTDWGDMAVPIGEALERLRANTKYAELFEQAFGQAEPTSQMLAAGLAGYQRSLLSGNSRFDRFMFAGESASLSPSEKRGLELFIGTAGCINCHDIFHKDVNPLGGGVALFTDFRFHNLGVGYENGRMRDVGRYEVTRDQADWGAFRTPSLRNVALTAPYMHDGSIETLDKVIDFYDRGGNDNPNKATGLTPLHLTDADKVRLRAFLEALTSEEFEEPAMAVERCGRAGPKVLLSAVLCP